MSGDKVPEVDAMGYSGPSALAVALMTGGVPMPCWMRVGRQRTMVTDRNKDGVCAGLLLAVDMAAAIAAGKSDRQDNDH
jgi:hypothetical protein